LQLLSLNTLQHDSKGDTVVSTADRFRNFERKGWDQGFYYFLRAAPHSAGIVPKNVIW